MQKKEMLKKANYWKNALRASFSKVGNKTEDVIADVDRTEQYFLMWGMKILFIEETESAGSILILLI